MRFAITVMVMFLGQFLSGQDCGCTINQVETNQVESCDLVIGEIVNVSTVSEFRAAIYEANQTGGNKTILIADGTYAVASTASYPYITASNMVIRSASGNRDAVILTGQGMKAVNGTEIGLSLQGDNITVADLTIKEVGNHGISLNSNNNLIHNVRIQNTFEQMIKGTSQDGGSDDCIVQCSLFEYTAGIGPQFYIGGLDIHDGDNWIVRDNIFKSIASPSGSQAEHAVHFWNNSSNNIVERNLMYNCDRGVGFGLGQNSANEGGIIRNNMITNDGAGPFNDVGIGLESSPNTKVYNNTIFISYQNSIEYRFSSTTNVDIQNNLTNKRIWLRNNGSGNVENNVTNAVEDWFVSTSTGNLRLASARANIIDQGADLAEVTDDIDQRSRPLDSGIDLGAHEFFVGGAVDADNDGFNSDIDCDDNNASVNPDATEIPNNDIDEDCDGVSLIIDEDNDGFNSDQDCDDTNAAINPDAMEIPNNNIDENCDGILSVTDADNDGFNSDIDCDDNNASVNPDATEIPNNDVDEDCDGVALIIDEDNDGFNSDQDCDDTNAAINPDAMEIPNNNIDENCDGILSVTDADNDGFNSDVDCDDNNASVNPDATEIPNNDIDEDCDGVALIIDEDNDGFNSDQDCDDTNAAINPDAMEIPNNNIDENCDGILSVTDADNDGFNSDVDCDDNNASVNPDATEIPNNEIDEDCDGVTLIIDEDNDGFNSDQDCDDTNAAINPDAMEIPNNNIDENCDGEDLTTGIEEWQLGNVAIYPNPVSDQLVIDHIKGAYSATILSMDGRKVYFRSNLLGETHLELNSLHKGVYFLKLKVEKNNEEKVFRLIKI
ncbi:MopE-related protein [Portibacter lacus]|uniref:Secretion system C-terminal sorting domain-containing protein n=1 Tax=Portibacter lacus TaxID=1099794 RepID=A0AA37SQ94_9BACT|nr:MopE-related protein [Portibacter lacus]GLR17719.1 hypothetical protein GCM10007940_23340 [Portibacter lacus]